ncbi:13250_t:CDS:1 [Acaulospora colombiana]|uniref:13250_t:CDS:1 n=1 Tax=Acaulospora colombiana TaxID=27376 RepID=A0ACA9LJ88_9GLOM|nr:13250_t:CDS:1 [Acaulospora colombiana]
MNIIHRDLHTRNVLINGDMPYICDFGCSIFSDLSYEKPDKVYGVRLYMAPEVINDKKSSKEADIFGLGRIIFEVITGRLPFHERKNDFFLQFELARGIKPEIPKDVSRSLKDLMNKCWEIDPENRPNAEYICDALKEEFNTESNSNVELGSM